MVFTADREILAPSVDARNMVLQTPPRRNVGITDLKHWESVAHRLTTRSDCSRITSGRGLDG